MNQTAVQTVDPPAARTWALPSMSTVVTGKALDVRFYRRDLVGRSCRSVERGDEIETLIEEMTHLCREMDAGGISAPQLGIDLRLAVALTAAGMPEVLVNPEIVNLAGRDLLEPEGCLSLPPHHQATARVWRSEIVQVRTGTADDPGARLPRIYRGQAARLVQHEIDHLEGIYFIDRCGPIARSIVLERFERYLKHRRREFEDQIHPSRASAAAKPRAYVAASSATKGGATIWHTSRPPATPS